MKVHGWKVKGVREIEVIFKGVTKDDIARLSALLHSGDVVVLNPPTKMVKETVVAVYGPKGKK